MRSLSIPTAAQLASRPTILWNRLLLATVILVQIPILGVFSSLTTGVFVGSLVLSMALMYALTSLCGLYPSLLATRVPPAEALHYE